MRSSTFLLTLAMVLAMAAPAPAAEHPLDPLSYQEMWRALEVLRDAGHMDKDTRFSELRLKEPAKRDVLAWRPGLEMARAVYAVVRQADKTYEATVDLAAERVTSWTPLTGVQPAWLGEEFKKVVDKVLEHPDFIAGLEARGITDHTFLDCGTGPPGYFGTEEERGRRIGNVRCSEARGVRNAWTRQVEGLNAVVDLGSGEVLRVVDDGPVPVTTTNADFDRTTLDHPREVPGPIDTRQPLGPGFEIDGYQVRWQNWNFHLRPDQRIGLVLSLVRYQPGSGASSRSVMYQGHLSEIFVPYMDPSFAWYRRNFIDAGEYVAGGLAKPLLRGRDCPDHAVYVDTLISGGNGRPRTVQDTICLYERETGDPAWRHYAAEQPDSRPSRDLVVRTGAVVGNYDYLLDWIFRQDGSIEARVGATGILEVKATNTASATESAAATDSAAAVAEAPAARDRDDAYGRFVDRNIVAVNHDHYFSYRLDLDIDGTENRFVTDHLVARRLPPDHPRRSLWVQEQQVAASEHEARLDIDMRRPALWRVLSNDRVNAVGYPTSFQVLPGRNATTLLSADDYPRRRAGFIDHHLWVTPYRLGERYAAGTHPTLSEPGLGLPAWTGADRPVLDTDLVLWHTVGMHHLPRAEDWPVMPTMWHGFELRPFDFFDRNPALDLP
jgi:primary-amine oxidase